MAAKTKIEKFIEEHFNIDRSEESDEFLFTPKDDSDFDFGSVTVQASSKKEACMILNDALKEKMEHAKSDDSELIAATLIKLAKDYPTDKLDHGYLPYYAKYLKPDGPKSILEIGCYQGDSIRMWREFFNDEVLVASMDLFEEYPIPDDIKNVTFITGNQKDAELLDVVAANNFDVVIDDGSHGAKDQWLVIEKFLKPGVLVIIEDLHCNAEEGGFWNQGLPFEETILGKIKSGDFPHKHELYLDKIVFIHG